MRKFVEPEMEITILSRAVLTGSSQPWKVCGNQFNTDGDDGTGGLGGGLGCGCDACPEHNVEAEFG